MYPQEPTTRVHPFGCRPMVAPPSDCVPSAQRGGSEMKFRKPIKTTAFLLVAATFAGAASAQMRDVKEKMTLPIANMADGIQKNLGDEIGAGRGNLATQNSSIYIINRDPFRAVRRGRQLFQRKFLPTQGFSGRDRAGNIHTDPSIGAGVVDSCAGCHGRPRGSAGFGGDVFTRDRKSTRL